MKEYKIEIVETICRIVTVEAQSDEEAMSKIRDDYNNAEIVLDYDDFLDVEFNFI
jgi:hypothetical protein